jgi:hypothetical protein
MLEMKLNELRKLYDKVEECAYYRCGKLSELIDCNLYGTSDVDVSIVTNEKGKFCFRIICIDEGNENNRVRYLSIDRAKESFKIRRSHEKGS